MIYIIFQIFNPNTFIKNYMVYDCQRTDILGCHDVNLHACSLKAA